MSEDIRIAKSYPKGSDHHTVIQILSRIIEVNIFLV